MSAISGSGTSASLLYLAIQSSASSACDDPSMNSTAGAGDAAAAQTPASGSSSQTSPLGDLRSQIETAVTNSLNQLPADSSPEDIFKAVRSAVQDTLKANGIEPSQIGGHHGGGHHHHHAGGAGGAGGASSDSSGVSSASDPDGNGDGNSQTTDPLLAALDATAGTPNTTQSATGSTDATTTAATGQSTQPTNNLLALFASGPNATDALSTLVQQLTGSGSPNGQNGGQSQTASPLLSALQNNSSGTLSLTDIFQQLFQNFPNGTGLDVKV
ncbi:MAG TPA: hypothetical protein VGI40_07285 [Pirellulaceae bacterium]|jgi:hypothetical protein